MIPRPARSEGLCKAATSAARKNYTSPGAKGSILVKWPKNGRSTQPRKNSKKCEIDRARHSAWGWECPVTRKFNARGAVSSQEVSRGAGNVKKKAGDFVASQENQHARNLKASVDVIEERRTRHRAALKMQESNRKNSRKYWKRERH